MLKENFDYTLVRPHEIRQRFTEYVIMNQGRALINSSLLSRSREDSFFVKQTIRQKNNTQQLKQNKKKNLGSSM